MTAIIESRPRIPRLAMVFIAAVVVLLLTAPKAGAVDVTVGDFTVSREYDRYTSTYTVKVTAYNSNETNIVLPTKATINETEYDITTVGSNVLKKLAGTEGIDLTVTIPEGYTTIKGEAFKNCYGLKTITIPGSVTAINYNAFDGCKDLAAVTFEDGENSLTFGNKVFNNCAALNSLALPARVSNIGAGMVQGCTGLTSLSSASDAYFAQDGALYKKNDDGNGYTLHSYAPGASATSFTIPAEVNGKPVTSIFRMAFQNNANLQSVTIPASVTDFQSYCLSGCTALKKITVAAESVTLANESFTNLPEGSVIEVANDTVKDAFEPSRTNYGSTETHYTAANTTVKVKSNDPEPEATPSASMTVSGTGVKDGYSYYTVKLDNAANLSTMIVNLSFDASQVSKDAVDGKKAAYVKVKDSNFMLGTADWSETGGKVNVRLLLTPANVKTAVTTDTASSLLLLALPVKAGVTGDIAMTVSAECAGVVSEVSTKGTVTVNGSPASNRITSYDVNADSVINILDITEAQRFYQVSSSDTDNWSAAQKADVNADGQVDIQDLIDIFLQIKF